MMAAPGQRHVCLLPHAVDDAVTVQLAASGRKGREELAPLGKLLTPALAPALACQGRATSARTSICTARSILMQMWE